MAEHRKNNKDPRGVFTDLAIQSGAMTDAGALSEEMFRFATLIAERCASIADADGGERDGGNAGDRIRAQMVE